MEERPARTPVIGREPELAELAEALAGAGRPLVHVVAGVPGIGKTTLWEAVIASASEGGAMVMRTQASEAEAQLSFAGLADLLAGTTDGQLDQLPPPQSYALGVALHRRSPGDQPPEELAVSLGLLNSLVAIAERRRLVVAVDDVQWLDGATASALAYAIRRLDDSDRPIRFLFAHRAGTTAPLLRAIGSGRVGRSTVDPLSAGAVRRVLLERLGLSLTRRDLHRLHDVAQGNPLFALELGRAMLERGDDVPDGELALPDNVEQLLGTRVSRLPPEQRRLLVAVAVCSTLEPMHLRAIARSGAVEDAADAGLLTVDAGRVRAAHPLLAASALAQAPARERRAIHATLAETVTDEQLRAKLLAGAHDQPDGGVADAIASAAAGAEQRGAFDDAVVLTGHAVRLTPVDSAERPPRVLLHARLLAVSGQPGRAVELLTAELESLPAGPLRAEALIGLASETTDPADVRRHLDRALRECPDEPGVRAAATAILALREAVIELRDVAGAEERLTAELPNAVLAGPELEAEIVIDLLWINALRGYSVADAFERFPSLPRDQLDVTPIPAMIDAQRLFWRAETAAAREAIAELMARTELGPRFYALNRLYACDLALRCGRFAEAESLLTEWDQSSDAAEFVWPMYERCRAQLAAGRGLRDETEAWVEATIARADPLDEGWNRLEAIRARGLAALAAGDPTAAVASLGAVWEHTQREAIEEPGVFPVAPDLVEALCETRATGQAQLVATALGELADRLAHPWAKLATRRSEAVLGLAHGDGDSATTALEELAADYARVGLELDSTRCLLLLGRAERRRKHWAVARRALERACEAFNELGATGWAAQARSELSRVGARRPAPEGGLTPSETRAAALAAEGLANKEIAAALHVTVHTVEVHLSRAYAKLGVRSRTQLAALLRSNGL